MCSSRHTQPIALEHTTPEGQEPVNARRESLLTSSAFHVFLQEDPRLKFPVHMRSKASLNPNDLGPLPVSTLQTHGQV